MMRLVCLTVIGLMLGTSFTLAAPAYQQTKDRKTYVWNPDYNPDEAVTWSGKRDTQHFATGEGTVIYYKISRRHGMGANVPEDYIPIARFSGTMVRGKLQGIVTSVDEHGQPMHADFVDGVRQADWQSGKPSPQQVARSVPSPSPANAEEETPPAPKPAVAKRSPAPQPVQTASVEESKKTATAPRTKSAPPKPSKPPVAEETATTETTITAPALKPTPAPVAEAKVSPPPRPAVKPLPPTPSVAPIRSEPKVAAAKPSPPSVPSPAPSASTANEISVLDEPFREPDALTVPAAEIKSSRTAKATATATPAAKQKERVAAATPVPTPAPSASAQPSAVAAASPPSSSPSPNEPATSERSSDHVSAQALGEPPSQRTDYTRYLHRRTAADPSQAFQSLSLTPQSSSSAPSPPPTP